MEIINYRRVTNLIVSHEAMPSEMLVVIEHSNCFVTTLQIAVIHSRIVATREIKCKNQNKRNIGGLYKYIDCIYIEIH